MNKPKDSSHIIFLPSGERAYFAQDEQVTVLELALRAQVDLGHSCGGMGSCTTCRVIVESDLQALPPRTEIEAERADERQFSQNERLSCQLMAYPNLKVRIPID